MIEKSYNTLHGLFSSFYESIERKIEAEMIAQTLKKELDFFLEIGISWCGCYRWLIPLHP